MTKLGSLIQQALNANRSSGDWYPAVDSCSKRAVPCGNPSCLDNAMWSVENPIAASQGMKEARKLVVGCGKSGVGCALTRYEGVSPLDVLGTFRARYVDVYTMVVARSKNGK